MCRVSCRVLRDREVHDHVYRLSLPLPRTIEVRIKCTHLAVIVVVITDGAAAAAGDPWLPTLNATLFLLVAGLMGEGDCIERASFPSPASPDVCLWTHFDHFPEV